MYDSYKRKTGATQPQNYNSKCEITNDVVSDFYSQPGYVECYKNNLSEETYDIIVMDGDKQNKTVGYKRLISYPYSECQFAIGDYVHFEYGGEDSIWLLSSLDKQFTFDANGRILPCFHNLNWTVGATPYSYPCHIAESLTYIQPEQEKHISLPEGDIIAVVQHNDITNQIGINYRFILGKNAWKVLQIKDLLAPGILGLVMSYDTINANDTNTGAVNTYTLPWA